MITIEKTYGVRDVAGDKTLIRIQEIISSYKSRCPVGRVVIDTEKLTFYKFGLKMGICRFATNGLVINEDGVIRDCRYELPVIYDKQILRSLYDLFGKRYIYSS